MIEIGKNSFMTLEEFIRHENQTFPDFIKSPLYSCDEEKAMTDDIIKVNEKNPGYIKYLCNELNAGYVKGLHDIIQKEPINKRNNPRLHNIIARLIMNMGIPMPMVYLYTEEDVNRYYDNENAIEDTLVNGNAFTFGTRDMLYVFVSDLLLKENKLTDEEIMSLIGHEIGHALCNHTVYNHLFVMNVIDVSKVLPVDDVQRINKLYENNKFHRYNEFTADRASLIATRSLDAVVGMLKKISPNGFWDYDHSEATHPNGKTRVDAVTKFSQSLLYARTIELIDGITIDKSGFPIDAQALSVEINKMV